MPKIEPRINIITLGVADMARSIRFYRDGLGWPTNAKDNADWAIFGTHGTRFALYPAIKLAADITPKNNAPRSGFGSFTLAHNVRNKSDVDAVLTIAKSAGAKILKPAADTFWGGFGGYFADPDGHPWEIAWSPTWSITPDGTLWGGDLGQPPSP